MPFRLNEYRAKVQFVTFAKMPSLIYKACVKTGVPSNTRYVQLALCEKLARDLDLPLESLVSELPPTRGAATILRDRRPPAERGRNWTIEEVR